MSVSRKPWTVVISGQPWTIRRAPQEIVKIAAGSGDALYGVTDYQNRCILIDERLSGWSWEDTVVHELLHAVHLSAGIGGREEDWKAATEEEERYVRIATPGVLSLLRDMPKDWRRR